MRAQLSAIEERQRNERTRPIAPGTPLEKIAHAKGADPGDRPQIYIRVESRFVGLTLRVGGLYAQARRQYVGPARQQIDGQRAGHRQCGVDGEHRPLNRGIAISTLTGQDSELVHGQIRGGLRLSARDACLRQLAFGLT